MQVHFTYLSQVPALPPCQEAQDQRSSRARDLEQFFLLDEQTEALCGNLDVSGMLWSVLAEIMFIVSCAIKKN